MPIGRIGFGKMPILKILLLLTCSLKMVELKKKAGNTINFSSEVTVCEDKDSQSFINTSELIAKRFNETVGILEGPFEFKTKIEGKIKVECLIEKILPTGTKELIATYEIKDFCNEVKNRYTSKDLAAQHYRAINFTAECPLESGVYQITNMVADLAQFPINNFPQGVYTITLIFYKYDTPAGGALPEEKSTKIPAKYGCLYLDCTIEPKG